MISSSQNCYLSVVVPVFNEEKKIEQDMAMIYGYFEKQNYSFEVVVVDDGSADGTLEKLKMLEKKYRGMRIVHYKPNHGKGCAVKTGILHSQGDYVLFADAGGCVPYGEVEKGLVVLKNGYDVAIGSRALVDSNIVVLQPRYRQIGGRLFWYAVRFFIGIKGLSDTQCGFKIFKREVAHEIFENVKIDGFMFDAEWILIAQKLGCKMKEFPVQWACDKDSRFRPFPGMFRVIYDLIRIRSRI